MRLTLKGDEIIEIMDRKDLTTFPGSSKMENYRGPLVETHNDLREQGFAEYYSYKEKREGWTLDVGAYQLTDRAYDYLKNKRLAGLNHRNIKLLNEKERKYVRERINFNLAK